MRSFPHPCGGGRQEFSTQDGGGTTHECQGVGHSSEPVGSTRQTRQGLVQPGRRTHRRPMDPVAARRTVSPLVLAQFRGRHPTLTATEADLVVEALRQWIRIEGRHPGHVLPSRAVHELEGAVAASTESSPRCAAPLHACSFPTPGRVTTTRSIRAQRPVSCKRTFIDSVRDEAASRPAAAVPRRRRGSVAGWTHLPQRLHEAAVPADRRRRANLCTRCSGLLLDR